MYTVKRHPHFDRWLDSIKDRPTRIRLLRRLEKAQRGLLGDVQSVDQGVYEMREFFGPGWRMYYTMMNNVMIVMLGGGNKSSQSEDIAKAITLAKTLQE